MAIPVGYGWAGPYLRLHEHFGRSSEAKDRKIIQAKKKSSKPTNGLTERCAVLTENGVTNCAHECVLCKAVSQLKQNESLIKCQMRKRM